MKRAFFLVFSFLSLLVCVSCKNITSTQTGYVADRDQCRSNSESGMSVYAPPESYPMSDKEKNTALLTLFCECMKQKDWKVAGCPKPKEKEVAKPATAPAATTVIVVQAPAAAPPPEQPEACPAPNSPPQVRKAYKAKHPKNVCPATDATTFDDSDTATLKKILGKEN